MILLNNDILSIFVKIKRLEVLRTLFGEETLYIISGVLDEIQKGFAKGYSYPQYVFEEIATGKIKILYLNERESGFVVRYSNHELQHLLFCLKNWW